MNEDVARLNAAKIYQNPNAIFTLGENNELKTISRLNLIGRLVEVIKNYRSGGMREKQISALIATTIKTVELSDLHFRIPSNKFMGKDDVGSTKDLEDRVWASKLVNDDVILDSLREINDRKLHQYFGF